MKNFIFISPGFPGNYENFCMALRADGVNVLGIGDAPYDSLSPRLRYTLTEYYRVENMEDYDTIILGYPNWWASIPMPIASFLEEYDFTGKTIIPFCSHGGGRFGQSLTAIAKLAPEAGMGEALSVHYSGGESLAEDVSAWLEENGITAE